MLNLHSNVDFFYTSDIAIKFSPKKTTQHNDLIKQILFGANIAYLRSTRQVVPASMTLVTL